MLFEECLYRGRFLSLARAGRFLGPLTKRMIFSSAVTRSDVLFGKRLFDKRIFFSDQETRRAFSEMSLARTFFSLVVERNCGLFEKLDKEDAF